MFNILRESKNVEHVSVALTQHVETNILNETF